MKNTLKSGMMLSLCVIMLCTNSYANCPNGWVRCTNSSGDSAKLGDLACEQAEHGNYVCSPVLDQAALVALCNSTFKICDGPQGCTANAHCRPL